MRHRLFTALALTAGLLVSGCSPGDDPDPPLDVVEDSASADTMTMDDTGGGDTAAGDTELDTTSDVADDGDTQQPDGEVSDLDAVSDVEEWTCGLGGSTHSPEFDPQCVGNVGCNDA